MPNNVPYSRQFIDQEDIDSVTAILESDFLTQGPTVELFEESVCITTGAEYAVAMNSATSALHVAMLAMDIGPGDLVWTSANSFAASSNCALYVGAEVDFVDIDQRSYTISPEQLEKKLSESLRIPDVLIVVHFGGLSCDMKAIFEICQRHSIRIVEDASHAIGATYQGRAVGSCQYSDVSVFSFHPVKIITTGEGGMATTNNQEVANKMRNLRTHGIVRDGILEAKLELEPWLYEQVGLGFNYRLTDVAAALGLSQIKKLPEFIESRNSVAQKYKSLLQGHEIEYQTWEYDSLSSYHLFVILLKNPESRLDKFKRLRSAGFQTTVHYIPIYHHPHYRANGFDRFELDNMENYYSRALSLPCYFNLPEQHINDVVEMLLT